MDLKEKGSILYVSSYDISRDDGPGVNEREFTAEFCNTFGERVHILVPEPEKFIDDIDNRYYTFCKGHEHYNPIAFLRHQISQIRQANILIKSRHFDFLVFRLDVLPFTQFYISRRWKIPYAIKTLGAGVVNALNNRGGIVGKALIPFNNGLVKDVASRAVAIDVCTEAYIPFFQEHLSINPVKLHWIENATNINRFYPIDKSTARSYCGLSPFDPIVGFVGGVPLERGGLQMVEMAPNLLPKYPALGIVIVGGGGDSELDTLKNRAAELGVAKHCVFTGLVPYEQVPSFVNAFDVGISFDTTIRLTQIGNSSQKIRQYIACGKPVVSGPGGNSFLENEKLGSIVKANNVEDLTDAVDKWLSVTDHEKDVHSHRAADYAKKIFR